MPSSAAAVALMIVSIAALAVLTAMYVNLRGRFEAVSRQVSQVDGRITSVSQDIAEATARLSESVGNATDEARRVVAAETSRAYREVEALLNLHSMVRVEGRVPPMRGWAASPDVLLLLVELLRAERPRLTVECGSGVSTLWCGLAIRHFGVDGRVVALEHDPVYASRTTATLDAHGVGDVAQVRQAPLETIEVEAQTWRWYARHIWDDLERIDLLFVDGPPGTLAEQARFPALPLLADRLRPDAVVLLDDVARHDEQEIVKRWLTSAPGVSEERHGFEKGASVLRLSGSSGWWGH